MLLLVRPAMTCFLFEYFFKAVLIVAMVLLMCVGYPLLWLMDLFSDDGKR